MHNRKAGANKKSSCGGFKVLKICVLLAIGIWLVQYRVNKQRSQARTDELETDGSTVILKLGRRDLPYVQQGSDIISTDHQEEVRGADQGDEPKGHQLEEGSYLNTTGRNESVVVDSTAGREGGRADDHEERGADQQAADHTSLQFPQRESETSSNYMQQEAGDQRHFSASIASSKSDGTTVEQESQVKSVQKDLSEGADREPNLEKDKQIEAYLPITTSNQTDHVTLPSSNYTDEGSLSNAAESLNTYDESSNRAVAESGTEASNVETVEASSGGTRADNLQDSVVRQVSNSDDETRILSPTFGGGGTFNNNDPSSVTEKTDMSTDKSSSTFGESRSFNNNDPSAVTERTADMSTHRLSSSFGGYGSFNNNDSPAATDRTDMSTNRLSSTIGGHESPNNSDLSAITERTDMSTDHSLNSTLAEPRTEEDDKIDDTATISRSSPYITRMQYSAVM